MKKKIILIIVVAIIIIISWARVIMSKTQEITDGSLNWLTEKKISHRGIHDNLTIPENSLAAFKASIDQGVSIELDVQLSKDKKVMVYHDYNLKRVTGLDEAFNPFVLEWFKNNAGEIPRGQLAGGYQGSNLKFYEKFLLSNLLLNFKSKPAFISYKADELPKGIVTSLRKSGTPILGWTVTKGNDLDKIYENCDNIIFE